MRITDEADRKPLATRLAWMLVFWLAGVVSVAVVAAGIRFWLR